MPRSVVAALVLLLSVSITPGVRELVIDLAHFASDGHAAHFEDCDDANEDEHGCTGPFHVCACHASMSMTPPIAAHLELRVPTERETKHSPLEARDGPRGHLRELLRPPTA